GRGGAAWGGGGAGGGGGLGPPRRRGGGAARQLPLGIRDAREPRRRQDQRIGERPTEDRRLDIDLRDASQHAGSEPDRCECSLVRGERPFVLSPAVDVVEHSTGQTPLGDAT